MLCLIFSLFFFKFSLCLLAAVELIENGNEVISTKWSPASQLLAAYCGAISRHTHGGHLMALLSLISASLMALPASPPHQYLGPRDTYL